MEKPLKQYRQYQQNYNVSNNDMNHSNDDSILILTLFFMG